MTPVVKQYGSDDERAYAGEEVPDKQSSAFFQDEVDDFHTDKDKVSFSFI